MKLNRNKVFDLVNCCSESSTLALMSELIPLSNPETISGNTTEKARLDVSARGIWGPYQKTMMDVRIFHPNADSYKNRPIDKVYLQHENDKRRDYEQRVLQVEKCSFVPLVYRVTALQEGWDPEQHHSTNESPPLCLRSDKKPMQR